MQLNELKDGQLARIICKSTKNKNTLITWVDELVVEGEVIRFSNYENYGSDWQVEKIDTVDTYENCKNKYGREVWFLRKIERMSDELPEV